jgi:hypothetical protein
MFVMHLFCYEAKQPNLKLKTRPKQLLGYLPLAFALPALSYISIDWWMHEMDPKIAGRGIQVVKEGKGWVDLEPVLLRSCWVAK